MISIRSWHSTAGSSRPQEAAQLSPMVCVFLQDPQKAWFRRGVGRLEFYRTNGVEMFRVIARTGQCLWACEIEPEIEFTRYRETFSWNDGFFTVGISFLKQQACDEALEYIQNIQSQAGNDEAVQNDAEGEDGQFIPSEFSSSSAEGCTWKKLERNGQSTSGGLASAAHLRRNDIVESESSSGTQQVSSRRSRSLARLNSSVGVTGSRQPQQGSAATSSVPTPGGAEQTSQNQIFTYRRIRVHSAAARVSARRPIAGEVYELIQKRQRAITRASCIGSEELTQTNPSDSTHVVDNNNSHEPPPPTNQEPCIVEHAISNTVSGNAASLHADRDSSMPSGSACTLVDAANCAPAASSDLSPGVLAYVDGQQDAVNSLYCMALEQSPSAASNSSRVTPCALQPLEMRPALQTLFCTVCEVGIDREDAAKHTIQHAIGLINCSANSSIQYRERLQNAMDRFKRKSGKLRAKFQPLFSKLFGDGLPESNASLTNISAAQAHDSSGFSDPLGESRPNTLQPAPRDASAGRLADSAPTAITMDTSENNDEAPSPMPSAASLESPQLQRAASGMALPLPLQPIAEADAGKQSSAQTDAPDGEPASNADVAEEGGGSPSPSAGSISASLADEANYCRRCNTLEADPSFHAWVHVNFVFAVRNIPNPLEELHQFESERIAKLKKMFSNPGLMKAFRKDFDREAQKCFGRQLQIPVLSDCTAAKAVYSPNSAGVVDTTEAEMIPMVASGHASASLSTYGVAGPPSEFIPASGTIAVDDHIASPSTGSGMNAGIALLVPSNVDDGQPEHSRQEPALEMRRQDLTADAVEIEEDSSLLPATAVAVESPEKQADGKAKRRETLESSAAAHASDSALPVAAEDLSSLFDAANLSIAFAAATAALSHIKPLRRAAKMKAFSESVRHWKLIPYAYDDPKEEPEEGLPPINEEDEELQSSSGHTPVNGRHGKRRRLKTGGSAKKDRTTRPPWSKRHPLTPAYYDFLHRWKLPKPGRSADIANDSETASAQIANGKDSNLRVADDNDSGVVLEAESNALPTSVSRGSTRNADGHDSLDETRDNDVESSSVVASDGQTAILAAEHLPAERVEAPADSDALSVTTMAAPSDVPQLVENKKRRRRKTASEEPGNEDTLTKRLRSHDKTQSGSTVERSSASRTTHSHATSSSSGASGFEIPRENSSGEAALLDQPDEHPSAAAYEGSMGKNRKKLRSNKVSGGLFSVELAKQGVFVDDAPKQRVNYTRNAATAKPASRISLAVDACHRVLTNANEPTPVFDRRSDDDVAAADVPLAKNTRNYARRAKGAAKGSASRISLVVDAVCQSVFANADEPLPPKLLADADQNVRDAAANSGRAVNRKRKGESCETKAKKAKPVPETAAEPASLASIAEVIEFVYNEAMVASTKSVFGKGKRQAAVLRKRPASPKVVKRCRLCEKSQLRSEEAYAKHCALYSHGAQANKKRECSDCKKNGKSLTIPKSYSAIGLRQHKAKAYSAKAIPKKPKSKKHAKETAVPVWETSKGKRASAGREIHPVVTCKARMTMNSQQHLFAAKG